jgi:hypothetical protein
MIEVDHSQVFKASFDMVSKAHQNIHKPALQKCNPLMKPVSHLSAGN